MNKFDKDSGPVHRGDTGRVCHVLMESAEVYAGGLKVHAILNLTHMCLTRAKMIERIVPWPGSKRGHDGSISVYMLDMLRLA